jgi:hypothetical protein
MAVIVIASAQKLHGQRFAIVGTYAKSQKDRVVQHVAILKSDQELRQGTMVEVWHVVPPIIAGERSLSSTSDEQCRTCEAHIYGAVELQTGELESIETWLAEVDKEQHPQRHRDQYTASPSVKWEIDQVTGVKRYRRFSCVGFVTECYREAIGVVLLTRDDQKMPEVDLSLIAQVYGLDERHTCIRQSVGVGGDGPFRLPMPGYVFHSLNRPDAEVRSKPYVPATANEVSFPAVAGSADAPRSKAPL